MFKKTLLVSIVIIYRTHLSEIRTNVSSFVLCTLLFIFLTFAREELQHLLENNRALDPLHCPLLTSQRTVCPSGKSSRPLIVIVSSKL